MPRKVLFAVLYLICIPLFAGICSEAIYMASIRNLAQAIRKMDFVHVYDNSTWGLTPSVLLQAESGEVVYLAEDIPDWLAIAFG